MTESVELFFRPDPRRAQQAVADMNRRLADSFRHIAEQARTHIPIDEARLQPLLLDLDGIDRVRPEVFGIYNDMLAAVAADNANHLETLFKVLCDRPVRAGRLTIRALCDNERRSGEVERIRRYAGTEAASITLFEPTAQDVDFSRKRLIRALEILRISAPDCYQEFEAIVSEIILIASDPVLEIPDFQGVSIFELWGGIVINPSWRHETDFDVAEDLVHEATHELLFALSLDEPLVTNPSSDRFASPLRTDPRPMDGIFHATFVVARVHYALSCMSAGDVMTDAEKERSRAILGDYRRRFRDSVALIREHGQLTDTGRQVLQGAEDYMASQ